MSTNFPDALHRFYSELRRRRVFRVAAAYAVVGWIITEVASVLVPALLLPTWVTRAIVLFVLLGFPIALLLAWAYDVTPEGVRPAESAAEPAAGEAADERAGAARRSRAGPVAVAALGILLAVVAYFLVRGRLQESERRHARVLLSEVERLADQGRYPAAYRLAVQADEALEEDTAMAPLWPQISDRLTVTSEPPGARVLARPFPSDGGVEGAPTTNEVGTQGPRVVTSAAVPGSDEDERSASSEFRLLGTTPLESLRIPRTPHLLRLEKPGFAPVERLASSALLRAEGPLIPQDEIVIAVELVPEDEAPDEMVFVPGGTYELVTPDLPAGVTAPLDDYFIDRYEVSNAQFREFVAAGGYGTRTYSTGRPRS